MEWNPNLGSHNWLAVGGQAGLLRVLFFQHPKNNFADAQSAKVFAGRTNGVDVNGDLTTSSELNFSAAISVEQKTDINNGVELDSKSFNVVVCSKAETEELCDQSESLQAPDEVSNESTKTVVELCDSTADVR